MKEFEMAEMKYGTAAGRAIRLRCPRCGQGPLFKNLITMYPKCSNCSLKYERAPGYFLGSTYLNYGFMCFTTIPLYIGLHYGAEISNRVLTPPLMVYCIVMPLVIFRYARAWWIAMDCYCDPVSFGIHSDPDAQDSAAS